MWKYDPPGVFLSKGHRLLGNSDDVDPQVKHCALQDDCICQHDDDCGIGFV